MPRFRVRAANAVLLAFLLACAPRETAVSHQFGAWLAAFNTGDRAILSAYHDSAFPYAVASHDVADPERRLV